VRGRQRGHDLIAGAMGFVPQIDTTSLSSRKAICRQISTVSLELKIHRSSA
jgi:hypothetical protein